MLFFGIPLPLPLPGSVTAIDFAMYPNSPTFPESAVTVPCPLSPPFLVQHTRVPWDMAARGRILTSVSFSPRLCLRGSFSSSTSRTNICPNIFRPDSWFCLPVRLHMRLILILRPRLGP